MVKAHPLNAPHTAGLFCDMSLDGPVIGTLVIIVDRAKNLPNRKTIGKQDPYCAARLGKEAKKTTTDIRGGQTPRWDQEIRFTVHDSPDYYQLKISVFNDDKKTDLIGETWVDLRDIVVPGGGQNDLWHNLTCKGKYAGEIRIELTYYDTRPKPEKPAAKPKQVTSETDSPASSLRAAPPKRRPLPSDPFTGQTPAQQPPPPVPGHLPAPARQHQGQSRDYPAPDHAQTPHRVHPNPQAPHSSEHTPSHSGHYSNASSLRHVQGDYSSASNSAYHTPSNHSDARHPPSDAYPLYPGDGMESPDHHGHTPDKRYTNPAPYGALPGEQMFSLELDSERPPPPPAHRSTPSAASEPRHSPGHDSMIHSQTPPPMRMDVLRSEAHRQSAPSNAYPGRPVYRPYDSAPAAQSSETHAGGSHQVSPPRHHSYDTSYDAHHKSMQATVEDVPDSPNSGLDDARRSGSRALDYGEFEYRQDPSPAPLSLRGRGSAPPAPYGVPPASGPRHYGGSIDHVQSDPSLLSRAQPAHAIQSGYDSQFQSVGYSPYRGSGQELEDTQVRAPDGSMRFALPSVPASLVPGVDPGLSMEISQRINEDRRHEARHSQPPVGGQPTAIAAASVRGRQMTGPPPSYGAPHPRHGSRDMYERSPSARPPSQHRGLSPNPSPNGQHTIRRKSISPAPPQEGRGLSGVPFGPDSYDALNPVLSTSPPKETIRPDYDEVNGKIITHDGKEIDPSDHLPMDTWAPEPEPKGKKTSEPSTRASLSGPQPIPPSGRKALRVREVRHTSALPPATYITPESGRQQLPPPNTGRNRLQKKANRSSAMPVMMSGANGAGPGPLAPLPQAQDNYAPRTLGRASTYDYENHAPPPMYDTSSGYARDHSASAPPIPAKIPLAAGPGSAMQTHSRGYGDSGGENALMEEMSRIDIGTGRARRHHQRMGY
ncbi:hypothetical protein KVR01_001396 [Diaporthe batatas]|uniref:uncharacterized protein n=1 Tax=Diaporthe batatas TaxID=748121 RepID=UPI001D0552F4|nr:uncharacterized protein KVR01_001396 [Diaporthe batatas]KAG8168647.1 hypothetical protein KVR01_001396 [Diaporthe batatas]